MCPPSRRAAAPRTRSSSCAPAGGGAAAARNLGARAARGRLLLFLDDDLVPAPDLVARHLARHDGRPRAVVGACPPGPPEPGLAELAAALWWHDHFDLMADAARLTFTGMLSGNLSIPRNAFLELGGFDEGVGRLRREDWLFGLTALEAGLELAYAPDAVAVHEFRAVGAGGGSPAAYAEGRGDALLIAAAARAGAACSTGRAVPRAAPGGAPCAPGRRSRRGRGRSRRPRLVLDGLERARLRRPGCVASRLPGGRLRGGQACRCAGAPAARREAAAAGRGGRVGRAAAAAAAPSPSRSGVLAGPGTAAARSCPITAAGTAPWPRRPRSPSSARARRRAPAAAAPGEPRATRCPLLAFGPAHRRDEDVLVRDTDTRIARAGGATALGGDRRAGPLGRLRARRDPDAARGPDPRLARGVSPSASTAIASRSSSASTSARCRPRTRR